MSDEWMAEAEVFGEHLRRAQSAFGVLLRDGSASDERSAIVKAAGAVVAPAEERGSALLALSMALEGMSTGLDDLQQREEKAPVHLQACASRERETAAQILASLQRLAAAHADGVRLKPEDVSYECGLYFAVWDTHPLIPIES